MATAMLDGVVIVGAGPTGLLLAAELALAGKRCVVLERRAGPRDDSRAICLHARSMEALDLRGQAGVFADAGLAVPSFPLGPHGAKIDFGVLDSDFPYLLDMPQNQIERLLLARARDLGAEIRWSATVTAVTQDDSGVTVTMADGSTERAGFVAGCDGVHSFVRTSAGIPFPGMNNPGSVILADLYLDGLPTNSAYGDLSREGMLLVFPFRDGSCRVVLYDYSRGDVPVTEPVDAAEVATSLRRVAGQDFGPRDMYWSGRYRSESRQVPQYRQGRILLAGDAAHAHSPAGAQGMNTGLQDSVNLGWKLAAELDGWGPDWLLDSYHAERHPVGAGVLALTGRQFALNTARSPGMRALRWAVYRLIVPLPPAQSRLARDYSGLSVAYGPPHPGAPPATASGPSLPYLGAAHVAAPDVAAADAPRAGVAGADVAAADVAGADVAGAGVAGADVAGAGVAGADVAGPRAAGPRVAGAHLAAHHLTGARLPPGTLTLAGSATARLYDLFHDGRFVLLEQSAGTAGAGLTGAGTAGAGLTGAGTAGAGLTGAGTAGAGTTGAGATGGGATGGGTTGGGTTGQPAGTAPAVLPDRVTTVRYEESKPSRLPAVTLVRPDGYIAWASDEPDPEARARAAESAVRLWCGPRVP